MLTTSEVIGYNLEVILSEKRIRQAELAERIGVPRQTINKIVHGRKRVSASELKDLANALGVSMDDFFVEPKESPVDLIQSLIEKVTSREARLGLMHAKKIMDLHVFHSELRESGQYLEQEWVF